MSHAPLCFPLRRALIGRALTNLIENALEYADAGDRSNLSTEGGETLTLFVPDKGVVADNGPGLRGLVHLQRNG